MRKKRPMRKQERERFVKSAKKLLLDLGAEQSKRLAYEFAMQTKAGILRLLVTETRRLAQERSLPVSTIPKPQGSWWTAIRTRASGIISISMKRSIRPSRT